MGRRWPTASVRPAAIEAHGLIGDGRSAALLAPDGSVAWWCTPRFDDPPRFDRLLDPDGPTVTLLVDDADVTSFAYVGLSSVLRTTWKRDSARVDVYDLAHERALIRLAECVAGAASARLRLDGEPDRVVQLREGDRAAWRVDRAAALPMDEGAALALRDERIRDDAAWLALHPVSGEHADLMQRSLLTLKLLTHAASGGIVAAPTTSLPEEIGGVRNWDYRFSWIRDTAFVMQAFVALGRPRSAAKLAEWILARAAEAPGDEVGVLYRVDGGVAPFEELAPLPGYEGSRPVRVGNSAVHQRQLDAYGHILEALDLARGHHPVAEHERWPHIVRLLDTVARSWRESDHGIWELPTGPRQLVYSKIMAWVAFDRAIRCAIAADSEAPIPAWRALAREIKHDVLQRGVDRESGALTQAYDSRGLDAANLRALLVGFLAPDDPIARATVEATREELMDGGFVLRYRADDGLPGREGAFLPCTLWLSEALAVMGRMKEARETFDRVASIAGRLGLFAEEYDPRARRQLGNYPLAFTHAALVSAAARLRSQGIATTSNVMSG